MTDVYDATFFHARSSETAVAEVVLGHLLPVVRPRSVVDLGAAVGTWLKAAKASGVETVFGIDGPWVPADKLLLAQNEIQAADLEGELPDLGTFDLAICVEVLEHLSSQAGARAVEWLCARAPVVLFSAAVPGQGGTNHVNEQWQSYWSELFRKQGYDTFDWLRPRIWSDERVPWWYRQNLLIMASHETGEKFGLSRSGFVDLVHPELLKLKNDYIAHRKTRTLGGRLKRLFRLK